MHPSHAKQQYVVLDRAFLLSQIAQGSVHLPEFGIPLEQLITTILNLVKYIVCGIVFHPVWTDQGFQITNLDSEGTLCFCLWRLDSRVLAGL